MQNPRRIRVLIACAFAFACVAALPAAAGAQSLVVDTASDAALSCTTTTTPDGDCSLRGAITKANSDAAADTITFSATFLIEITFPLPDVTKPLAISAVGRNVVVTHAVGYGCGDGEYALDITESSQAFPGGAPQDQITVTGLPFNGVCGRAIRSLATPPVVSVGPRRSDNSVPIVGTAPAGSSVDIFKAKNPTTADGEADTAGFLASVSAAGGAFSYKPVAEPTAADLYAATATQPRSGANGASSLVTSNFTTRIHTPADLVSPVLNNVVATSTSQVRLDFSEALSGGSAIPSAIGLGMANVARPVVGASVNGNSLYLNSNLPWGAGEAGAISFTGNGTIIDTVGNELLGLPTAPVYAGPGEVDGPIISNFKLSPNRFCQRKSSACKRGYTWIYLSLNKPARVIFKVARGTARRSELVTFVHRLKAGKNKVKFDSVVSGRTLPATVLTIRAVAQDVARTLSPPVDTPLKIVKNKRDL